MHLLPEERPPGAQNGLVGAGPGVQAGRVEEVAREMLHDKLVVGHIGIEGAHQVVPVTPGICDPEVAFMATGFGIADKIHPMSRPSLAVVRRGQESLHRGPVPVLIPVCQEGAHGGRRRRQTRDGEVDAAEPMSLACRRRRLHVVTLQRGEDESVDFISRPCGSLNDGGGGTGWDLPDPGQALLVVLECKFSRG